MKLKELFKLNKTKLILVVIIFLILLYSWNSCMFCADIYLIKILLKPVKFIQMFLSSLLAMILIDLVWFLLLSYILAIIIFTISEIFKNKITKYAIRIISIIVLIIIFNISFGEKTFDREPLPNTPTEDDVLTLSRESVNLWFGEEETIKIGIYNPTEEKIVVTPELECNDDKATFVVDKKTVKPHNYIIIKGVLKTSTRDARTAICNIIVRIETKEYKEPLVLKYNY